MLVLHPGDYIILFCCTQKFQMHRTRRKANVYAKFFQSRTKSKGCQWFSTREKEKKKRTGETVTIMNNFSPIFTKETPLKVRVRNYHLSATIFLVMNISTVTIIMTKILSHHQVSRTTTTSTNATTTPVITLLPAIIKTTPPTVESQQQQQQQQHCHHWTLRVSVRVKKRK